MFFCCGGGSRQVKTREDFVTAAAGFDSGVAPVDEVIREDERAERASSRAESSGKTSSDRRSDGTAARIERVEQVPWSSTQGLKKPLQYKEIMGASREAEDTSPLPPPPRTPHLALKMSELTRPMSSPRGDEQLSIDDFNYADDPASLRAQMTNARTTLIGSSVPLHVDDAAPVPPRRVNEFSPVDSANNLDAIHRSERPVWRDYRSEQPGPTYDDAASVAAESVRPSWLHRANSFATEQARWRTYDIESETGESELHAPSVSGASVRRGWLNLDRSTVAPSEVGSAAPGWHIDNEDTKSRRPSWIPTGDPVLPPRPSLSDEDRHVGYEGSTNKRPRAGRKAVGKPAGGAGGEVDGSDNRISGLTGRGRPRTPARDDEHSRNMAPVEVERKLLEALDDRVYRLATEGEPHADTSPVETMGGESTSEDAARPRSEMVGSSSEQCDMRTVCRRIIGTDPEDRTSSSFVVDDSPSDEGGLFDLIDRAYQIEAQRRRTLKYESKKRAQPMSSSSPNPRTAKQAADSGLPVVRQESFQATGEVRQVKIVQTTKQPVARERPPMSTATPYAPPSPNTVARFNAAFPFPRSPSASNNGARSGATPMANPARSGNRVPNSRSAEGGDLKGDTDNAYGGSDTLRTPVGGPRWSSSPGITKITPAVLDNTKSSPSNRGRRRNPSPAVVENPSPGPAGLRDSSPLRARVVAPSRTMKGGRSPTTAERPRRVGSPGVVRKSSTAVDKAVSPGGFRTGSTFLDGTRSRSGPDGTVGPPVTAAVVTISSTAVGEENRQHGNKHVPDTRKKTRDTKLPSILSKDVPSRGSWDSGSTSSAGSTKNNGKEHYSPNTDRFPSSGGGQMPEAAREERKHTRKAPSSRSPAAPVGRVRKSKDPSKTSPPRSSPKKNTRAVATNKHPRHAPVSEQELGAAAHASGYGDQSQPTLMVIPLTKNIVMKGPRGAKQPPRRGTPAFRYFSKPIMASVDEGEEPLAGQIRAPPARLPRTVSADPALGGGRDVPKRSKPLKRATTTGTGPDSKAERVMPNNGGGDGGHIKDSSPLPSVNSAVSLEVESGSPVRPGLIEPTPVSLAGSITEGLPEVAGPGDETAKSRNVVREGSVHSWRNCSQRLLRSSSMDEGSILSFHAQPIFSPNRFNAGAGALSWVGSLDDSCCGDSVRSFGTGGTRNSSSTSLVSGRGPSDRKMNAPHLTDRQKQAVERLKIQRANVNFPYRPIPGSQTVYKAELNGKMRAAKVINILGLSKEAAADVLEIFDAELLSLARLDSPNIVKVYGAAISPADIIVVSEFVEGGTLRDMLVDSRKHPTTRMRLSIAQDIAAGMGSLYSHGMQHRHLSSSSVLLTSDWQAKIYGMGMSMTTEMVSFFRDESDEDDEGNGLPWDSREVLAGAGFSEKSDVYSFGIVLWEIMQGDGSLPFAGLLPGQVVSAKYAGQSPPIPPNCPAVVSNLMERCWSNLPADRPTFESIFSILENADLGGN